MPAHDGQVTTAGRERAESQPNVDGLFFDVGSCACIKQACNELGQQWLPMPGQTVPW